MTLNNVSNMLFKKLIFQSRQNMIPLNRVFARYKYVTYLLTYLLGYNAVT